MFQIKGSGKYLPERVVTSLELDQKLGFAAGTFEKASGVQSRRYASEEETPSYMGAQAAKAALEDAGLQFSDIDLILGASGTMEQAIPCTAALIQKALGQETSGVPGFDVNSTCLSFMAAMQVAHSFIAQGVYKNILIVSSEVASVGLDYRNIEGSALFGDGAAAFVVGRPKDENAHQSKILAYQMETYSSGSQTCQIAGGGSKLHPSRLGWDLKQNDERFLFQMDGPAVFKIASKHLLRFFKTMEEKSRVLLKDAQLFIPHQASSGALELVRRKLEVPVEKMCKIIGDHGNMIAASIPLCLHYSMKNGTLKPGDVTYLLGTSAGFSMGVMVLQV